LIQENHATSFYENADENEDEVGKTGKRTPGLQFPFEILSCIPAIHIKSSTDYKKQQLSTSSVLLCNRQTFIELTSRDSENYSPSLVQNLSLIVIDNVHEALKCSKIRIELQQILEMVQ
jgi:hypothetical protein